MTKLQKTPHERGLTASTDLRIIRRPYKHERSPSAMRIDTLFKQVDRQPPVTVATQPANSAAGGFWSRSAGSTTPPPQAAAAPPAPASTNPLAVPTLRAYTISTLPGGNGINYDWIETPVEYVLQQAWYGPYGEKEWQDIPFEDQVPEELQ